MPRSKPRRRMARGVSSGRSPPKFCHSPSETAGSCRPLRPERRYGIDSYRSGAATYGIGRLSQARIRTCHDSTVSFLRTISTPRLAALCASVAAVGAGGTAIAVAGGSDPVPPPKPLASAVHDGLKAPEVQGITARVKFTNHLIDSSGIHGASPLLSGATGRLWLAPGKALRLELQSDGSSDSQVFVDKRGFWVYDGSAN